MELNIPCEEDWENYSYDMDIADAYENFSGKSNDEMQLEFKKNVIERSSDLGWMPMVPFQYYIFGFKRYIDVGDFNSFDKPDAASCFIRLVQTKLLERPEYVRPILPKLMPTLEYIANNQESFEADLDIYGDFKEILHNIKAFSNVAQKG